MSKQKVKLELYREIKKLNNEIDRKIVKGLSYAVESRRHKMLLSELRKITGRKWIPRPLAFLFL